MKPCSSILAATDFSAPARHAADRAARLAHETGARLTLLHVLSAAPPSANGLDRARLADELAALLHGHGGSATRLSDAALVKLFRLLRLARRLLDLEAGVASQDS